MTGCNRFRRDGINLNTPCALASRLSIYISIVFWSDGSRNGFIKRSVLASDFSEKAGNAGERGVSRNLAHSTSSFSPNKRRRSEMERSFAVSRDMVEVAGERDSVLRIADAERLGTCTRSGSKHMTHHGKPRVGPNIFSPHPTCPADTGFRWNR